VSQHADIAAAYDRWAVRYDEDRNKTRDMAASVLRQADLALTGRAVIEIGCGTGFNTGWLTERSSSITALDFSEGMLRRARARVDAPHVRFLRHDIRDSWPVATHSADVVIAMLVFEHVEHLLPAFAEAFRCLRPGGDFFLCELHPSRQLQGRQAEFVNPATGRLEQVPSFVHSVSAYVDAAFASGFSILRMDEWRDAGARQDEIPRLFSALCRVQAES
jgi:ubiquinone/menaquinone biosynthesis C-methylase UbiE